MLKPLIAALALIATPALAQKQPDIPALLAQDGIAPTLAVLDAVADPDPTEKFALGAVRFLRAIEKTLQTRWRLGINAERSELPVLRLPVPANPAPEPFTADIIATLFADLVADMDAARAPLLDIADSDSVDLPVAINDLWFDINMNATRDKGEGVAQIAGLILSRRGVPADARPVLHFDTADAAWLAAYTHFLSFFAELVLAFEPTDQIARIAEASALMDGMAADTPYPNAFDFMFGRQIDRVAMVYFALQQQPDPDHTTAAHDHALKMIAQNRVMWTRLRAETDNSGEWIPNDDQDQALGLNVPAGTGDHWLAVLDEAEALLNGDKLIPHWRFREGAGVNLKKLMLDPVPVDLAEWIHGIGLLPFAEPGVRVKPDVWRDFERLVQGDTMLFAVFLN